MTHKYCFQALDKTLTNITSFKGKENSTFVIPFIHDFGKILPVIPRGSRSNIINATINSSYIWDNCQVLTLTKNMRDGKLSEPNDDYALIEISEQFLITNYDDPIHSIVKITYPNLVDEYMNEKFIQCRPILASTIEKFDEINDYVISLISGDEREYLSSDSIDRSESNDNEALQGLTPEFINSLRTSGSPNHKIKLKIGTLIMLLRKIDLSEGLCNGTRMIVNRLATHVIEAEVMTCKNVGKIFYIPQMSLSPFHSPWPFKLTRRQFPLTVLYDMTINKLQRQSLTSVGLYLP
ncbi:hypothetical protein Lal_00012546 [Lupinus albus]|nr:hypothetical protein Lal_00012546 [Lupinus albus]